MRLRFIRVTLRDFKSFKGQHDFELDLPLGLHFIRGRNLDEKRLGANGTGKSTIWDALVWCLFGMTPGKLRNPDVTPWNGAKKGTRVILELEVNGTPHVIVRRVSPNVLKLDGKDVGPEAIVKLIGMSFEVLTNTIILGQGRPLFFDMTPSGKMQLLSDVKGLERWDERSKRASDGTRTLEQEHATLLGEQNGLSRSVGEISAALKELYPKQEQWTAEHEQRLKAADEFMRTNGKRMKVLQRDVDKADLDYDSAMTELKALERDISKRNENLSEAKTQLFTLKARRDQALEGIERAELERKAIVGAKKCPMCGLTVSRYNLVKHDNGLRREIKNLEASLDKLTTKGAKLLVAELEKQLADVKKYLDKYHVKADDAIRRQKAGQAELSDLKAAFDQIKRNTDAAEENPHAKSIRMLRKRRDKLKADHDACTQDVVLCAKELERTRFWIKGFKDIKLHVIEELLQELELATSGMLEEVGLIGWRIRYDIERETKSGTTSRALSVMIGSPRSKGKLVKWESWSGGEGQRLRVVGALALASVLLNHAGVRPSLEVLDEPTQHLSDEGIHDLCDYLAERAMSHKRRIFYCDHQSVDGATFASTITVRRDDTGSHIVTGG